MTNMISLLRSFRDGISLERQRGRWRVLWLLTTIKLAYFIAVVALIWVALAHAAPAVFHVTGAESLRSIVDDCVMTLFQLQMVDFYAGLVTMGPYRLRDTPPAYAHMLVNLVAARDMSLAQAVPIELRADITHETRTIGPMAYPTRELALSDGVYLMGALAGVFAMLLGVAMDVVTLYPPPPPQYQQSTSVVLIELFSLPFAFVLIGAVGVLWALVTRRFARMERQGFVVTVDADGVTFRLAGRAGYERRMRWSDAHAFARLMHTDVMGRMHEVFVLSRADEDMLWEAMYTAPSASPEETQREEAWRVAAHELAEQVALRTGLPLLDVTKTAFAAMVTPVGGTPQPWSLFRLARKIAQEQGDTAFASDLARRADGGRDPLARLGGRFPSTRKFIPEQRDETLRLAHALAPYYPTPAQVTPSPRRRLLTTIYWNAEFAFYMFIIALLFANVFVMPFLFS